MFLNDIFHTKFAAEGAGLLKNLLEIYNICMYIKYFRVQIHKISDIIHVFVYVILYII